MFYCLEMSHSVFLNTEVVMGEAKLMCQVNPLKFAQLLMMKIGLGV